MADRANDEGLVCKVPTFVCNASALPSRMAGVKVFSGSSLFSVDGVARSPGLAERGIEGSRGLQSTDRRGAGRPRRGATMEKGIRWDGSSSVAPRRARMMGQTVGSSPRLLPSHSRSATRKARPDKRFARRQQRGTIKKPQRVERQGGRTTISVPKGRAENSPAFQRRAILARPFGDNGISLRACLKMLREAA